MMSFVSIVKDESVLFVHDAAYRKILRYRKNMVYFAIAWLVGSHNMKFLPQL